MIAERVRDFRLAQKFLSCPYDFSTYILSVLGKTANSDNEIEAVALTVDQNGENEAEQKRIISEHPSSETETLLVGGRLFGHTAVTRCKQAKFLLYNFLGNCPE